MKSCKTGPTVYLLYPWSLENLTIYRWNLQRQHFQLRYLKTLSASTARVRTHDWILFRHLPFNCLNWKIYCDDHSSPSSTTAVQYEFHLYFTSFHCTGRYELNKLTSLPTCGFTAQLVEHRTGIAEITFSNPVESRWSPDVFLGFFLPIA